MRSVHFLNIIHIIQRSERLDDLAVLFVLLKFRTVNGKGDGEYAEAGVQVRWIRLNIVDADTERADSLDEIRQIKLVF